MPSILITGASSGIGRALAYEMGKRGYSLALLARDQDRLKQIQSDIIQKNNPPAVKIRPVDVADTADLFAAIKQMANELGGIDIVFANAGIGLREAIGEGLFENAKKTIEVNLIGAMATVDAAVDHFLNRGHGHIVGNCSVLAYRGMAKGAAYSASKAGLAAYLEAARVELLGQKIDVSVLYPGYIDTPINDKKKRRPFAISAEASAAIMARMIEKKVRSAMVPRFPWSIIVPLLRVAPAWLIARL